jgi:hypothetical protein
VVAGYLGRERWFLGPIIAGACEFGRFGETILRKSCNVLVINAIKGLIVCLKHEITIAVKVKNNKPERVPEVAECYGWQWCSKL